jgi:hypothetical protein
VSIAVGDIDEGTRRKAKSKIKKVSHGVGKLEKVDVSGMAKDIETKMQE